MTLKSKKKISQGLKKYFEVNPAWNKGQHNPTYTEPAAKRFRRDKNYYLKELELNAKRSKDKNYYLSEERISQINKLKEIYFKKTGVGRPPKLWAEEEMKYLRENYNKKTALEIALNLGRSWSSIMHKVNRLGLQKYNKWN